MNIHGRPSRIAAYLFFIALLSTLTSCERAAVECDGYCGTAIIVVPADFGTLFPPAMGRANDLSVAEQVFQRLAQLGPDANTVDPNTFEPQLAESWTFEDSLTIAFHLNPQARWHDGNPVTAHDVEFTFGLYRNPAMNSPRLNDLTLIESVTARDSQTVAFTFTRPYIEQFYDAAYHMQIVPEHILGDVPVDEMASHAFTRQPMGSGAYRFVRWTSGESLELEADSAFYLGRPGVRRVVWQIAPDPQAIVAPLVANNADLIEFLVSPENADRVEATDHMRVAEYTASVYFYMGFNFRDAQDPSKAHWLFSDRNVRRAIAMSIDQDPVVEAAFGRFGEPARGPITPIVRVYNDTIKTIAFDTAQARKILTDAGWQDSDGDGVLDKNGRTLSFEVLVPTSSPPRTRGAVTMQAQLQRVGIDMQINELEFNTLSDRVENGRFDAQMGAWLADNPSPRSIPPLWTSAGIGGQNYGSYANSQIDSLFAMATAATDPEIEASAWQQAFNEMNQDVPAIWLVVPIMTAGVHTRYENVSIRPNSWLATLREWRVKPGEWLPRDVVAQP